MTRKPVTVKLLIGLFIFLGLGAVMGGGAFIIDPSGELIGLPVDLMQVNLFSNYLIPGIVLLLCFGVTPLIVASALMLGWPWKLGDKLSVFKDKHWSWSFSLYIAFALIIWITVQVYILKGISVVHLVYIGLGLAIQIVTLLPSVSNYYINNESNTK
jgi:hypothetical protein